MTEKLIGSKLFKEAEVSSWKIFNPKKYFENKVKIRRKNTIKIFHYNSKGTPLLPYACS